MPNLPAIRRKLKSVTELTEAEAQNVLGADDELPEE